MNHRKTHTAPPRIEYLKVANFRALRNVELKNLTPMTVLLGPNGSGKSTVFDVFAFLAECFEAGLRRAWDRRGRAKELKTRGAEEAVTIEIKYRERPKTPLITYHLAVDETADKPVIVHEWLSWKRASYGAPFRFLEYQNGRGQAASGEAPDAEDQRVETPLKSPDLLAVNALGQFQGHPRVAALRDFIMGWHVSYLSAESARGLPEAGPHERLTRTGDNLANVIQYLSERHPERLERIFQTLRGRVPLIERVVADTMQDGDAGLSGAAERSGTGTLHRNRRTGELPASETVARCGRLLLQIKDAPFDHPVLARFASDGTLKMLAYLVLLNDPEPAPFIGIEEPENFLHPRLLHDVGEECRAASARTQLLVTTHSPFFLDALRPEEVRVLWRDLDGHTRTRRIDELPGVSEFIAEGAKLGDLWMEGQFGAGDPLKNQGGPAPSLRGGGR